MQTVGQWVEARRKTRKMSRADVMRATGLSAATIVRLEGDEGGKSASSAVAIGRALGLTAEGAEALAQWAKGIIDAQEFSRRSGESAAATSSAPPQTDWAPVDPERGTPILGEVSA